MEKSINAKDRSFYERKGPNWGKGVTLGPAGPDRQRGVSVVRHAPQLLTSPSLLLAFLHSGAYRSNNLNQRCDCDTDRDLCEESKEAAGTGKLYSPRYDMNPPCADPSRRSKTLRRKQLQQQQQQQTSISSSLFTVFIQSFWINYICGRERSKEMAGWMWVLTMVAARATNWKLNWGNKRRIGSAVFPRTAIYLSTGMLGFSYWKTMGLEPERLEFAVRWITLDWSAWREARGAMTAESCYK